MPSGRPRVSVCYFSHPPFTDTDNGGGISGVFWHLTHRFLSQCSGGRVDYDFRAFNNENHLLSGGATRGCNVSLPVTKMPLFDLLTDYKFLPVITTPGAAWLDPTLRPHQSSIPQLNFVLQAWLLLVIILVSCAYAGVIAWVMERLKNPQEFPRPFLRGFWEGCWWAFITMTTVGYGDRSPKTVCGRLFAFMWISFGLVVTSMFTAGITTALGQSSQSVEDFRLFQTNMTVLNGSYEETLVFEVGSSPIVVNSWESLVAHKPAPSANGTHLDSSEPSSWHYGALMEHFMYMHIRQEHPEKVSGLKLQMVLKRPSIRGLLTRLDQGVTDCLIARLLTQQHKVYGDIVGLTHQEAQQAFEDPKSPEGIAKSLFFTNKLHLLVLAFGFLLLFTALLCWEKLWWTPRNPDYQFIEHNWKYERQKKEAEFSRQLDFKTYYKRRKSSNSSLTPPAGAAQPAVPDASAAAAEQQQQQQPPSADPLEEEGETLIAAAVAAAAGGGSTASGISSASSTLRNGGACLRKASAASQQAVATAKNSQGRRSSSPVAACCGDGDDFV